VQFLTAHGRCLPVLPTVEDLPDRPGPLLLENLMSLCADILSAEPGGRVAFLRSRPGSSQVSGDDRAWARDLRASARASGLHCEPVHLATNESVQVIAPDDLAEHREPGDFDLPDSA
jgi:hypothetical protein